MVTVLLGQVNRHNLLQVRKRRQQLHQNVTV